MRCLILLFVTAISVFADINARDGVAITTTSDLDGGTATISAVDGQTIATGGGAYTPNTADFAGTTTYLERNAQLHAANDDQLYFSFWIKPDAAEAGTIDGLYGASDDGVRVFLTSGDKIRFDCEDAANTSLVVAESTASVTRDGNTWTHVFIRLDRTVDNQIQIYINGTAGTSISTFLSTAEDADPIDLDAPETTIGALDDAATFSYAGCMADFWMNVGGTYANIVVGDFISAGDPVDLGATGTGPDGNQPIVFLKGDGSGFNINSGSGGNFTAQGTALTACSNAP